MERSLLAAWGRARAGQRSAAGTATLIYSCKYAGVCGGGGGVSIILNAYPPRWASNALRPTCNIECVISCCFVFIILECL